MRGNLGEGASFSGFPCERRGTALPGDPFCSREGDTRAKNQGPARGSLGGSRSRRCSVWREEEFLWMLGWPRLDLAAGILISAKLHGWHLQGQEAGGRRFTAPCSKTQERKLVGSEDNVLLPHWKAVCGQRRGGGGPGGATLSEGHEEFIWLLCVPAHELEAETMAGRGPLSPSPQRPCQMLAVCGWGAPSLGRGSPVTWQGTPDSGLISWELNFPFGQGRNHCSLGPKVRTRHLEAAVTCVCLSELYLVKKTGSAPHPSPSSSENQSNDQPNKPPNSNNRVVTTLSALLERG